MTVTCPGTGASIWYPCKDHQSDEPDNGASLTMIVPDTLVGIGNGRMQFKKDNGDGTVTYKWTVESPINSYCLIPYIGKYKDLKEVYKGEKGNLDIHYWTLDYYKAKAESYMLPEVHKMFKAFEYWFALIFFTKMVTHLLKHRIQEWNIKVPFVMVIGLPMVTGGGTLPVAAGD